MVKKLDPTACMWGGLTFIGYGVYKAIRATPEACRKLEERKKSSGKAKLTVMETVQSTWKGYALPALALATGATLIVGADTAHCRRNAALMTGLTVTQQAYTELRDAAKEKLGEKKMEELEHAIDEKKMASHQPEQHDIQTTKTGQTLFYDRYCDRYFYSTPEKVRQAGLSISRQLIDGKDVDLDDFYFEIGLRGTELSYGRMWSCIEHRRGDVEVCIDPHKTDDDVPCLSFHFNWMPEYQIPMR